MAEIILQGSNDSYQFDPENLDTIIGKGGMGVVFKGFSIEKSIPVAVKVLYREITTNLSNVERERQSAGIQIHHPNIVRMLDFVELNGIYHIISEFLVGKTLHNLIEDRTQHGSRITDTEANEIIKSVLVGLDALHKQNIIHRDIDPSNIFLCENGTIKIMDFGIAKISDGKRKSLTGIGTVLGKPHYSPPEQIRGESAKVSPASDLYSLAISYYEMLTGRPPFNATNEYDLMKMQIENSLPDNSFISPTTMSVLRKATEKDPTKRYQSSQEFLSALTNNRSTAVTYINKTSYASLAIIFGCLFFAASLLWLGTRRQMNALTSQNNKQVTSIQELSNELKIQEANYAALERKYQDALQLKFDIPLKVTYIQFANRDENNNLIGAYGNRLDANKIKYLYTRISYINLSNNRTIKLMIKIINPDGSLSIGTDSPTGYSYSVTTYGNSGFGSRMNNVELTGWGNEKGGSFGPGNYKYEIYSINGKLLGSTEFSVF